MARTVRQVGMKLVNLGLVPAALAASRGRFGHVSSRASVPPSAADGALSAASEPQPLVSHIPLSAAPPPPSLVYVTLPNTFATSVSVVYVTLPDAPAAPAPVPSASGDAESDQDQSPLAATYAAPSALPSSSIEPPPYSLQPSYGVASSSSDSIDAGDGWAGYTDTSVSASTAPESADLSVYTVQVYTIPYTSALTEPSPTTVTVTDTETVTQNVTITPSDASTSIYIATFPTTSGRRHRFF